MLQTITALKKAGAVLCLLLSISVLSFAGTISGSDEICVGSQQQYTYDQHNIGYTYTWSVTGATSFTSSTNVLSVFWGSSIGTYTVTVNVYQGGQLIETVNKNVQLVTTDVPLVSSSFNSACIIEDYINIGRKGPGRAEEGEQEGEEEEDEIPNCFTACDSSVVIYSIDNFDPNGTYHWYTAGGALESNTLAGGQQFRVKWGEAGAFPLVLTYTNAQGCVSYKQFCVIIFSRPQASFTSIPAPTDDTLKICQGSEVKFTNTSTGYKSGMITWIFGNEDVTNTEHPSYTFLNTGVLEVKLVVENECGCTDTFTRLVKVAPGVAPIIECPSVICANGSDFYTASSSCNNLTWTITGASGSPVVNGASVSVQWGNGNNGNGLVCVRANCPNECPYDACEQIPIVAEEATITGTDAICVPTGLLQEVYFSVPFVPSTLYAWQLSFSNPNGNPTSQSVPITGNGTNKIIAYIPNNSYYSEGTLNVKVTYYNTFLRCGGLAEKNIPVEPSIEISGELGLCENENYTYDLYVNGGTVPNINLTEWTLVNAATGTQVGTTYTGATFTIASGATPGNYILTATNPGACNSTQRNVIVIAAPAAPTANVAGPLEVCPEAPYEYIGSPTQQEYTMKWSFVGADASQPSESFGNVVSVLWGSTPPFKVQVKQVSTFFGCASDIYEIDVNAKTPPTVTINGSTTACGNSVSNYTLSISPNQLLEEVTWRVEPVGVGGVYDQTATSASIQWLNVTQSHNVNIIVRYKVCPGTFEEETLAVVVSPAPALQIGPYTSICAKTAPTFTAPSGVAGSGSVFSWDFNGDGVTDETGQSVTYTNGFNVAQTYPISLTVTNAFGCGVTKTATAYLEVKPSPDVFISATSGESFCTDATELVTLTSAVNTLPGVTYTYQWSPSGAGTASTASLSITETTTFTLTVTNTTNGCAGVSNQVTVTESNCGTGVSCDNTSSATLSTSVNCATATASLTNITLGHTSILVDFGDGSPSISNPSDPESVSHTYANPGTYRIRTLVSYGNNICAVDDFEIVTIKVAVDFNNYVECTLPGNGHARIKTENNSSVASTSGVTLSNWSWSVGGNSYCSNSQTCTFSNLPQGATSSITLSVDCNDGGNTYTCSATKSVAVPQNPSPAFTVSSGPYCWYDALEAQITSTTGVISYEWNFSDGTIIRQVLNQPSAGFDFEDLGASPVLTLKVKDEYGCIYTSSGQTINYQTNPNTNFNNYNVNPLNATICDGSSQNFALENMGTLVSNPVLWIPLNSTGNPISIAQSGVYEPIVMTNGCREVTGKEASLQRIMMPEITFLGTKVYCAGDRIQLSTSAIGNFDYRWVATKLPSNTFHDQAYGQSFEGGAPLTVGIGLPYEDYQITLTIISSSIPACTSSASTTIRVYPNPNSANVNITITPPGACLTDGPVTLTAWAPFATAYGWSTGSSDDEITVYTPGKYVVNVYDENGCKATKQYTLEPPPDLSQVIHGCYDTCIGVERILSAPQKIGYTYQWYQNGVAVPAPDGTAANYNMPGSTPGTNTYYVEVTNGNCISRSKDILVTLYDCSENACPVNAQHTIDCVLDEEENVTGYDFTVSFMWNFPGGILNGWSTTSGTLTAPGVTSLTQGLVNLQGTFTPNSGISGNISIVLDFIKPDDSHCYITVTMELPSCTCTPPPFCYCPADLEERNKERFFMK